MRRGLGWPSTLLRSEAHLKKKKSTKIISTMISPTFIRQKMFHHHGRFSKFSPPSPSPSRPPARPPPRSDHAITSPKSLFGTSIQAYFRIHSDTISTQLLKTALAKCSGARRCWGAGCRAYQTDMLERRPSLSPPTARAGISSGASISLKCYCLSVHSVGAF